MTEHSEDTSVGRHEPKAVMTLSGEMVEVGVLVGLVESNPYLKIAGCMDEPTYFSIAELDLLVAGLHACKADIAGEHV